MMDDTISSEGSATTILALDLGKFKSVACVYEPASGTHRFETIATTPSAVHDLLVASAPSRLVIEACSIAGWIADLARTLSIDLQVANVNTEAWKWQRVKRKTDRDDALKLAKMSMMNQLPTVHVPEPAVRQHRG
jgi:transposase